MIRERLLIVDDEKDMLRGLSRILAREFPEMEILTTASAREALALIQREPVDIALIDVRMPEMNGLDLLEKIRQADQWLTVIMMTAYGSIELAVEAVKRGAYDFTTKPFDKEALFRIVRKSLERNRLIRENLNLRARVCEKAAFANFVGQSPPMLRLYEKLQTVAHTDYNVLIRGESGTGKEVAARAIHGLSKRRHKQLVMVNCPAIPEHLLESELFGHKRGAFTGADRDQSGLFEEADGGTICLDEIGDIPVAIQTKLLRVIQEQEIKPLGAPKTRQVDVRVIAVTNRNLEEKIIDHSFREDLFYRLNVVTVNTPALREIREDIPLLVDHFLRQAQCETGLPEKRLTPEALEILMQGSWPGNVRELQNFIRRLVVFTPHELIRPEDLRPSADVQGSATIHIELATPGADLQPYKVMKEHLLHEFTADYITRLLEKTGGNVTRAAELSGLTRAALQKIMRRSSINPDAYRVGEEQQ
jgi:DNA-binding NtrC family response regulator